MKKKPKLARMQKAQRNADEKVLRALAQDLPKAGPGRQMVLRHGNTLVPEEIKP